MIGRPPVAPERIIEVLAMRFEGVKPSEATRRAKVGQTKVYQLYALPEGYAKDLLIELKEQCPALTRGAEHNLEADHAISKETVPASSPADQGSVAPGGK